MNTRIIRITEKIIGAAIEVNKRIGSILLESACEECPYNELDLREIDFRRQVPLVSKKYIINSRVCRDLKFTLLPELEKNSIFVAEALDVPL